MNKNNLFLISLVAFILITLSVILIPSKSKTVSKLRVVPTSTPQSTVATNIPSSDITAKSGWEVYRGAMLDIVYPSGFVTQISDTYEFAKFSSSSLKISYQVYVPAKAQQLDKNFSLLDQEKIESKSVGGSLENCTQKICTTDILVITGPDYKKRNIIRKDKDGLVVSAISVQYPNDQEAAVLKDFEYFQQQFVIHKRS